MSNESKPDVPETDFGKMPPFPVGAVYTPSLGSVGAAMYTYTADQMRAYAALRVAADREAWAKAFDAMREKVLSAQSGPQDDLSNVMLRQLAELGFGECAAAIRAAGKQA